MKKSILFSLLFLAIILNGLHAQLTVVQGSAMGMTPQQLVQNYLVGPGITVTNVTYNGSSSLISSNQVGTFATAGQATTQLGLTGGILMTSGTASIAIGPNTAAGAGASTGGGGDPDLNIVSGSSTFDKAVIEFDFIPQYDTIKFRYVFGSEEFMEYCGSYNDAFGFFLSGPGISGTFSNSAVNIAIMPGSTTVPVTINNICGNVFSRWLNNNGVYYQYDALTHVFTAKYVVQPCQTYHIKLAIADAVDHIYDSGVFLEENSFSSPGVSMNTTGTIPPLGNNAYEGCNDIIVSFKLSAPLTYKYYVNLIIGGTATNGIDYAYIPDTVAFLPNQDSTAILIHPLLDGNTEGLETVIITVDQISCSGAVLADTINILDYMQLQVEPLTDTTVCYGTKIHLTAVGSGGIRPYDYSWNGTPGDSTITITPPVGNDTYVLKLQDVCQKPIYDTAMILVHPLPIADPGQTVTISNGTSTTLHGNASGGFGSYSYSWSSNPPGFSSTEQNPTTGNLYYTTIYVLVVTDLTTGCVSDPAQVMVIVAGGPLSANPVANPQAVCLGDSSQLFALAGGGSGLYTYSWTSNPAGFTSTLPSPGIKPDQTTTYTVILHDGFNQVTGSTTVVVNPLPYIHLGPVDSTVCVYEIVTLDAGNPGSTYEWSNGATSRTITFESTGIGYEVQSYKVWVTNNNSCLDSATINVIFSFDACTGIHENKDNLEFLVFPNPSQGNFTVRLKMLKSPLMVECYDLMGSRVFTGSVTGIPGQIIQQDLDLSQLPAGLYILRLYSEGITGTKRIIIRHD